MPDITLRRYAPAGLCAIEPAAFGLEFPVCALSPAAPFGLVADGKVAIVHARGPLTYDGFFFASYGGILGGVREALASNAEAVILKLHSPGGDVFGAFETARALRAASSAAGKRLIAFTDSQACSSAYALASAADEIVITESASVGSIGVIGTAAEQTKADAMLGIAYAVITSGARKADGNPHVQLSDEARAAMQRSVDQLAQLFFALVADHRGLDAAPLEAGSFIGAEAVSRGLADATESFETLVARVASGAKLTRDSQANSRADMPKDPEEKDEARKALAAAAEDKDEKKAARAKRALKAYDESDDKEAADDKPEPKDEEKKEAAAPAAAPSASAAPAAVSELARTVQAQAEHIAKLTARQEASDRAAIFAARPDIADATIKALAKTPLDQLQAIVDSIPVSGFKAQVPELGRAPAQGDPTEVPSLRANADLDERMGLVEKTKASHFDAKTNVFAIGVSTPKKAP